MISSNIPKFFRRFPTVFLGDIVMRDLQLSDADGFFALYSNPMVSCNHSDEDTPNSKESAINEIKFWSSLFYKKRSVFWAIADRKTNKIIGTIGFISYDSYNRKAEISYDLSPEYWRQGIMTKVLNTAIKIGLEEMNIYRIEARTMMENVSSQSLLRKMHFKHEGILRGYRFIRGKFEDIMLYSLILPDHPLGKLKYTPISPISNVDTNIV